MYVELVYRQVETVVGEIRYWLGTCSRPELAGLLADTPGTHPRVGARRRRIQVTDARFRR